MNLPEHETGRAIGNLSKEPCLTTELFRLTIRVFSRMFQLNTLVNNYKPL